MFIAGLTYAVCAVLPVSMVKMFLPTVPLALRDFVMGLWLARVDDIGELESVLNEEHLDREH